MQISVTDERLEVHFAPWQKMLGLMRDISLDRSDLSEAEVVQDPLREAMGAGIKVGLRLPWLYYAARTIRLDQLFVVRRGVPALGLRVNNDRALRRILLSTSEAERLAARLQRP
jgi:hypothetical protein